MRENNSEKQEFTEDDYYSSSIVGMDFVDEAIMPALIDFEWNKEEDYVPGSATMHLFVKLTQLMGELKYTPDEMKQIIDENWDMWDRDTYH